MWWIVDGKSGIVGVCAAAPSAIYDPPSTVHGRTRRGTPRVPVCENVRNGQLLFNDTALMIPKVKLQALFFDMDGVLVDVSRSYQRAIEETVEHFTGRTILPGTIQRYRDHNTFSDDWRLIHAIITDTGMSVSFGRVLEEFQRRYRGESWDGFISEEPPLVKLPTLEHLCQDGRVMGIVTARPAAEARWTLERFGWERYFPLLIPKEKQDGRVRKDPYALQHALLILDAAGRRLRAGEVAYVAGTADDMVAARAAGMWAIGFVPPDGDHSATREKRLRDAGAHVVVHDLSELSDLVDDFEARLQAVGSMPAAESGTEV